MNVFQLHILELAIFAPFNGIAFINVNNKDASLFPITVLGYAGKM